MTVPTLRTNLQYITDSSVRDLAFIGGVETMSDDVPETIRILLNHFLEQVISKALTMTEHAHRKTMYSKDILSALNRKMWTTTVPKRCPAGKTGLSRNELCLTLPITSFDRLVREVGANYKYDVKYSAKAISYLQQVMEVTLTELFSYAHLLAHHATRDYVTSADLTLAVQLHLVLL